ncbi:MAG: T9SS type A sorting domain-containing protein [Flavipsychrobacter sp.]
MRKLLLTLLILLPICYQAKATLNVGDIAVIGINCDGTSSKTFAVVTLAPIASGETIFFTDRAILSGSIAPLINSEGTFSLVTSSTISAGTVIMFTITGGSTQSVASSPSVGTLTITDGGWTNTTSNACPFGINGDQILIYQTGPTFIFGFNNGNNISSVTNGWNTGGSSGTNNYCEIPPGLTNGTNAIGFGGPAHIDNMMYNGTRTGSKATLLAAICNSSNWISDDVAEYDFSIGGTNFSGSNPIFNLSSSTTWNGTTWSNGAPTSTTDAIIASSTTPGNFTCKALTINSGVSLTMNSGATANINGNLTNSGNGFSGTGTFNFATSSALSGNAISCAGTVTVASGATLTTGGLLTLTSDATNTGRIGNSAGTVSGNITQQRYIPGGRRAYRFLAHPFTTSQPLSILTDDIDITGNGGSTNGFTTTGSNNPSAFWYNVATANGSSTNDIGWTAFTSATTSSWAQYAAVRVLVRGAIGEGLTSAAYTPSAVTLDMAGTVNQGTQTISCTKGSGTTYALVGNPFPSPINMDALSFTGGIGTNFYIWNAQQGTKGGYTTYTYGASSFSLPTAGAFVTQISANGTVIIEEADKTASTSTMFKTTGFANRVTLNIEDSTNYWDRLQLHYDDNTMAVAETDDALKFPNPEVTFSTFSKDDSALAIDNRPYTENETILLGFSTPYLKNYKISVPDFDMPAGTKLYLKDNYTGKNEELSTGYEYWFTVDTNATSQGKGRFELNAIGKPTSTIGNIINPALKVKLVPNPTTDNVTMYYEGAGNELNITVTNMMGIKVATANTNSVNGNIILPTSQLTTGIYIVTVQDGNKVQTQKLIKQ